MPVAPRVGADDTDAAISSIAAAIGVPARARMLCYLLDGKARTSTELAAIADVSASTASAHLNRLHLEGLVRVMAQGRHRYFSLDGPHVASALEALSTLVKLPRRSDERPVAAELRRARTCYDHLAGALGVLLNDRFIAAGWLISSPSHQTTYELGPAGVTPFNDLGIDVAAVVAERRRFAYACLDWTERRPHLGGALAAAVLRMILAKGWVIREPNTRVLAITPAGRRAMASRLGLSNLDDLLAKATSG